MKGIEAWYGNGGRFAPWRMVYAPDDLATGPKQVPARAALPRARPPAAAEGRRLQGRLVRHPHRGAHQGERGRAPTCHPTAAEAMSAAWRHVGGEIPQGRE